MKLFRYLVALVAVMSMLACIAAIPIAVMYMKSDEGFVAEAEIPAPAEKVYRTAVDVAKEKAPVVKILEKDDAKFYLAVTDDIQKASVKVEPIDNNKAELIVKADIPKVEGVEKEYEEEKEKELALRIVNRLCQRLKAKCKIIK